MLKNFAIALLFVGLILGAATLNRFIKKWADAPTPAGVVATFEGGQLTEAEVMEGVNVDPHAPVEAILNLKLTTAVTKVKRRLLELEAANKSSSPEEVLAQASKNPSVTEAEVNAYLRNTGKNPARATKAESDTARALVGRHKMLNAGTTYLEELYKNANVKIILVP